MVAEADVFSGNRHFIVVQNDQHVGPDIACVTIASNAATGGDAPSPITQTVCGYSCLSAATAMPPIPALMEVEECPTLSTCIFASAPQIYGTAFLANVGADLSRRPVRILCDKPASNIPD